MAQNLILSYNVLLVFKVASLSSMKTQIKSTFLNEKNEKSNDFPQRLP